MIGHPCFTPEPRDLHALYWLCAGMIHGDLPMAACLYVMCHHGNLGNLSLNIALSLHDLTSDY